MSFKKVCEFLDKLSDSEINSLKLILNGVNRGVGLSTKGVIKTATKEQLKECNLCDLCKYEDNCDIETNSVCNDELNQNQYYG